MKQHGLTKPFPLCDEGKYIKGDLDFHFSTKKKDEEFKFSKWLSI